MNIEQLVHIVEVAKMKSISKASETLHITQSGISQSISSLENELNIKIFRRSRIGTVPTEVGKEIILKANDVLNKVRELREEAEGQPNIVTGELRLAGMPGVTPTLVKIAAQLKRKYRNITVEIIEKGSFEIMEGFLENNLDAGFIAMSEKMIQQRVEFTFESVIEGKIVLCVGRDSPLSKKKSLTPEELKNQTFVLYQDDYINWFIRDFSNIYGEIDVLFSTNNGDAIVTALTEDMAVTIGHDYSFANHPLVLSGELITIDIENFSDHVVYFGWITQSNRSLSSITKEAIDRFNQELFINYLY
ncbi:MULTISPECIES: LysR family transcriptional regulator [unclassified Virgibacillus]|uniref:LysR family transcriptional regulator n=1 Tax=unclassified Virgibacillus TaxID=2620237 RepID=UPI0024DEED7C|nr:LysR family transcriptional regulator [Virgibacillus sp. LDC-1]